jgi:hypothetical protein
VIQGVDGVKRFHRSVLNKQNHYPIFPMKKPSLFILLSAILIPMGCNQEKSEINARADAAKDVIDKQKQVINDEAATAKRQTETKAVIDKADVDAASEAAKAQLDANKEKVDAAAAAEKARVDALKK